MRVPVAPSVHPDFIARAEEFSRAHRDRLAFRLLAWFMRADASERDQLVKSLYCACVNNYDIPESRWKSRLGLLLLPANAWCRKTWLWRAQPRVRFTLETIDRPYFDRWFSRLYALLPDSKRLTPRDEGSFAGAGLPLTRPWSESARAGDLILLTLLAAPLQLLLWRLSAETGLDLLKAGRQAVSLYVAFNGYFRRYPTEHFITFEDVVTQPSRYLAFRRNSSGDLIVIQNGSRIPHPMFAYGMMDRYLVFGEAYAEAMRAVRVSARSFEPVGALCLDERHGLFLEASAAGRAPAEFDILFVDQGVYPWNGIDRRVCDSMRRILDNLSAYGLARPGVRIAYQLRDYGAKAAAREAVLALLRERHKGFIVLENDSLAGTSYRNILRSELVMTFESTLGLEALRMGRKACFVNYSGDPSENVCEDARFQLDDESADYGRFERKVDELLQMPMTAPPPVASRYHHAFDGRLQERLAEAIVSGQVAAPRRIVL